MSFGAWFVQSLALNQQLSLTYSAFCTLSSYKLTRTRTGRVGFVDWACCDQIQTRTLKDQNQMLFAFKLLCETATCFLWRVWHQATAAALAFMRLAEPWEYSIQPWLIGPESVSTAQRTHFHPRHQSTHTHTHTHTLPARTAEMRRRRQDGKYDLWSDSFCAGVGEEVPPMDPTLWDGCTSRGFLRASRNPWRGCFFRGNTPSEQERSRPAAANQR